MSIKYLNPKTYGQVYQKLVNGYRKVKGKDPAGLDLIKIKLEAAEQIRNSEKVIKFPEKAITDWTKERPIEGPQADVKKFPTKDKPATQTSSLDFFKSLLEDFNKISKNQPSLAEITGVSDKYPEKTGIVQSTIELLESKDPKSLSRELQKIMKREGTYVDYSDEEIKQILNGFQSKTKDKIKSAEDMIDEGDFDPSGFAGGGLAYMLGEPVRMFKGGRIGYSVGAGKKGVQGLLDLIKNKFGKKSITTADKIARPESAVTRDMFKQFNERMKQKDIKNQSKETYERLKKEEPEIMAEFDEMWEDPEKFAPNKDRLLTDDEIKEYEEVLGDSETWMTKGTLGEADEAIKRQMDYEKQMYAEYRADKQARKELEQAYKEIDFRMTGEDTKYEANELAGMLSEIRYKTEYSDLPQKTQIDLYDEAYDYLMEVKRDKANFKGAINIKTGKNIVTGEQEMYKDIYQKAADDSLKKINPEAETYAKELEYDVNEQISKPGYRGVVTEASDLDDTLKIIESQKSEATKLREQYPGISEALLNKIVKDNNPQRKAEVLASLDEVLTMMDKGMDEKQIMDVLRKTTRTKNASGGLNYLMGL